MGARISIQFKNKNAFGGEREDKSVVLFSHWGGEEFAKKAKSYVKKLKSEVEKNDGVRPLDRLEPNTVMIDFIREITKGMDRVESDLYLGVSENDGDNSDYGHHIINLNK